MTWDELVREHMGSEGLYKRGMGLGMASVLEVSKQARIMIISAHTSEESANAPSHPKEELEEICDFHTQLNTMHMGFPVQSLQLLSGNLALKELVHPSLPFSRVMGHSHANNKKEVCHHYDKYSKIATGLPRGNGKLVTLLGSSDIPN